MRKTRARPRPPTFRQPRPERAGGGRPSSATRGRVTCRSWDELSAVIEFPCQREMCHYAHVPTVYIHYPPLSDAVGGNRLMSERRRVRRCRHAEAARVETVSVQTVDR